MSRNIYKFVRIYIHQRDLAHNTLIHSVFEHVNNQNVSYGQYEVGHVAVPSDDLEARDGIFVADDIGDLGGPELLHPRYFVAMTQ